jgi:hypothetical protein
MHRIRQMTGVCPQHDILFDMLTPREHLEFFAAVRVSVSLYQIQQNYSAIVLMYLKSNYFSLYSLIYMVPIIDFIKFSLFLSVHIHERIVWDLCQGW